MAHQLSTTSHAVLGLLALKPWTTYELAKQVQRSLGWFWPRTERKLYDEPKHLVAAGLATASVQHRGNRPSTVYTITRAGRTALRRWLSEPSTPPALEFEAMVKTFFADAGSLTQLQTTLDAIANQAEARLATLRVMIEEGRSDPYEFAERLPINALALRFHLDHVALQARWATWAAEQIGNWRSTTDPGTWNWLDVLGDD